MSKKIKLSTPVEIERSDQVILSNSKILTLGSCFSDHVGSRLLNHGFVTRVNPFGTIFNPISISKSLKYSIDNKRWTESELNVHSNRYFHYDYHTTYDDVQAKNVLEKINSSIGETHEFIKRADYIIITFGTSIVYKLNETDRIVSNCHKVPNKQFSKSFLSAEEMERTMFETVEMLRGINSQLNIILTVSPVRHTKEGILNNSRSKARLIELCHRLEAQIDNTSYFAAYEIMMDELRDYRFYKSDLIHPNELAVDIIWDRFKDTYFDQTALEKVKELVLLNNAMNHKPFDPNSKAHLDFKSSQLEKIQSIKLKYPETDFKKFEDFFKT